MIVEPDALAQLRCLTEARKQERLDLLRNAVDTLAALPGVAVYLDAGHAGWSSADTMAWRLTAAGGDKARGFALNVSYFGVTEDEISYGRAVSARVGGAHFVVDTSRNGQGPAPRRAWCNPPGRGLGVLPAHGWQIRSSTLTCGSSTPATPTAPATVGRRPVGGGPSTRPDFAARADW